LRTSASPYGFVPSNCQSFYALLVIQDVTDLTHRIQAYRTMRDQALEEVQVRQRVEEELRSSQHFIQQIADAAPYLLYIYDLTEQRNVYVNGQASNLLGYTPQEILQMQTALYSSLVYPEDLPRLKAHQQKFPSAQDGHILELDYRLKHRSGEWRWFAAAIKCSPAQPTAGPNKFSAPLKISPSTSGQKRRCGSRTNENC
jgi:PAS domain S-box-containing protein